MEVDEDLMAQDLFRGRFLYFLTLLLLFQNFFKNISKEIAIQKIVKL